MAGRVVDWRRSGFGRNPLTRDGYIVDRGDVAGSIVSPRELLDAVQTVDWTEQRNEQRKFEKRAKRLTVSNSLMRLEMTLHVVVAREDRTAIGMGAGLGNSE